ncbi:unnamed protein product [Schistosoma margrebowiei]|uniref:Uncharacterized protein n=1 Tax=Schistosoma margrebowiei TaxID=48269 RepID=A0A183N9J2_9TREM|nr:unnamed protein product [Schistosoma margrebowiei]
MERRGSSTYGWYKRLDVSIMTDFVFGSMADEAAVRSRPMERKCGKTDLPREITFSSTEFSGIDLPPGGPLIELEYSDDIVLFSEDADKMQSFGSTRQQCNYVWNALLSL